jgi:hypothetical protein
MGFQALRVLDHPHPPLTSSEWRVRVVEPTPGRVPWLRGERLPKGGGDFDAVG